MTVTMETLMPFSTMSLTWPKARLAAPTTSEKDSVVQEPWAVLVVSVNLSPVAVGMSVSKVDGKADWVGMACFGVLVVDRRLWLCGGVVV